MKNLNKLGLIIGSLSALALALPACSDDPATDDGTGGKATGGAGGKAGSASTGGGGAGGKATGGGGATAGGMGGKATGGGGAGGAGGSGGKAGAGGTGGTGGTGGGAPSADCTKWCSGAMGVVMSCAANDRPAALDTEAKCLAECKDAPAASLTCWNTHLTNANAGDKDTHCEHAMGNPGNGQCAEL